MAFTRDILVRLPGPNSLGDPWGIQWTFPGQVSPGPETVQAKMISRSANGDVIAEIEKKRKLVTPDDDLSSDYTYRFIGRANHAIIASLNSQLNTLSSDPNAMVSSIASTLRKILRDNIKLSDIVDLMNVANGNANASVRANALILVAVIITNEL